MHDAGNYRIGSHVNALDKVDENIGESRICGHLSKMCWEKVFKGGIILKGLTNIGKKVFEVHLIDEVHLEFQNFFRTIKSCSGE